MARLGAYHRNLVDGTERDGDGTFEVRSPIDTDILVGTFARGTREDVRDAIAAARRAQPAWFRLGWERRLEILRRAAELISERQMEYAGLMAIEVGKTRLEALGEVEEAADLIRYYARTAEDNALLRPPDGQPRRRGGPHAVDPAPARRVRGHQPVQLPDGARGRADLGGDDGRQRGRLQAGDGRGDDRRRAHGGLPRRGRPGRRLQPRDGPRRHRRRRAPGRTPASTASCSPARTRWASSCSATSRPRYPRPCIVEMGGKNPAIVLRSADLEEAAEGILRSAFGFGGQKCSANSRVYVERAVHDELVRQLVEKTEKLVIGNPLPRPAFIGPVIDERAVDRHQQAVAEARRDGTVFTGGERLTDGDLARGFYVEPTVVGLPAEPPPVPGRAVRAVHRGRGRSTRWTRRSPSRTTTCTA